MKTEADEILLSHPPEESKTYWCQGCGCDRAVKYRVFKYIYHQGRMYRHPRCVYCMNKIKEQKLANQR